MSPSPQAEPPVNEEPPSPKVPAAEDERPTRPQAPATFRDRFCQAAQCAPHEFADRVFLLALHFHALFIIPLLWPWRRRLFAADFALIEKVAGARWRGDMQWKLDRMRTPEWHGGLGRQLLRCRISTQRLGTLMSRTMSSPELATAQLNGVDPTAIGGAQNA